MPTVTEALSGEKKTEAGFQSSEVWAKVTGKAIYGSDIKLPGMLYGKILRSPHPHARIKKIDLSQAVKITGVRALITGAELPAIPYGIVVDDELPLTPDLVRYIGDEVAAVAAIDYETASRAAGAIKVGYEQLPAVFNPREALKPGAPQLHEQFSGNLAWERNLVRGDSEAAFKEADAVVENTFTIPSIHSTYLEPTVCVAENDPYNGLIIHTALQSPDVVREIIAKALDLPFSKVRIVGPVMGGGFGGRVYGNLKLYIIASLLAIKTGRPVKMQLTREEEFLVGRPMIAAEMRLKMAFKSDGKILAREADIVTDNGAYSAQAPWVSKTLSERNDSVYHIPSIKTRVRLAYTNKVPTGQYRAYGNQADNFATESLLDMAAAKLGIDPLELRLKNCVRTGDTTVHGLKIKSCALSDCLKSAAEEIGWQNRKAGHGYGISAAIHANGSLVFDKNFRGAAALARLELDGRVSIFSGEQDYGQGTHATFTLIAAQALGLSPDLITIYSRDTLSSPHSLGALGMRQTTIGGKAVQLAAEKLRELIVQTASNLVEEPVVMERGTVRSASGKIVELPLVAYHHHSLTSGLSLIGEGHYVPAPSTYDETGYGNIAVTYSFAAHSAEVEVDKTTGAVTVHKIVAAHDSGKIINQISALGQVLGGVTQGLGMSSYEGYLFDGGRVANASLTDYRIPTSLDVPDIVPIFIENEDPEGPYGAKGLGEIVQIPVIGAVANAVADATGVRITDLPITAEKVYQALSGWECET
ncbi:MAG: xanthine dehydrogenase family protein molybdopterin-binding subunit [Dethiobacteria bacterium]|nr:xanthine dehydrogenase family protein molybdopterin-binding subunit [Dethiobacteria bacterium]